jgi:SAM-dependent methyltransferase
MDAAVHRFAETQGREPVNRAEHAELGPPAGYNFPVANGPCQLPVAEGYERWAPIYDRTPNPLLAREERYLTPLLLNLHYERILDVACGTGRWLEKLQIGGSGVGVDCSLAMLRVARTKAAIAAQLAGAYCESLPFRASTFDLAICSFALGHIRDLALLVHELGRVVKPGADVFISDLHPEAYAQGWRVGFRDDIAVEIQIQSRAPEEISEEFRSSEFDCLTLESLYLGQPEQPIFARAGKAHIFAEACKIPAVLILHFKRRDNREQTPESHP